MGHCQKIKTERVLADQIFIVSDQFPEEACPLQFAADNPTELEVNDPQIGGTLLVTVTNCQLLTPVLPDDPLQVEVTLMYQKELCVTGGEETQFAPPGLVAPFSLEFKFEETYLLTFCLSQNDLTDLGVNFEDIECQLYKIVDVLDDFSWTCGEIDAYGEIATPAEINQTVTSFIKIKLVSEEQVIVALCPTTNSKIVRIPRTTCGSPV